MSRDYVIVYKDTIRVVKSHTICLLLALVIGIGMVGCGDGAPETNADTNPPADYEQHGKQSATDTKSAIQNRPKGYPGPR